MKYFFNPKSVALIGASDKKGSVGLGICRNLLEGEKRRKIFFVNPNKKRILSKKSYSKIGDIKEKIDLAVIAVPAKIVKGVVKDCAQKKVKRVVIISSGFAETGEWKRQKEIKDILKKSNIPLLGPNCLGVIKPSFNLNATFSPGTPKKGRVAFVSQSGALLDSIIDKSLSEDYGFSALVSLGNSADLGFSDFLEELEKDPQTKAIALYIEGLKEGKRFIETAQRIKKPIVALKGGVTPFGKMAVGSHTASLAGEKEIYSAAFRKGGIFEVETINDLLNSSFALANLSSCENSVGILTNGGAIGVLLADWCWKFGIKLAEKMSFPNPWDILGDALSEDYRRAGQKMLREKKIKGLIFVQTLQIMTEVEKNAKVIVELGKRHPQKPIIALFLGGEKTKVGVDILKKNSIPCLSESREAALVLKALIERNNFLK